MNTRLLLAAALCVGLALPVAAQAQQAPAPVSPPATNAGANAHHRGGRGLNRRALQGITLSDDQKAQMRTLRKQYRTAHPAGSAADPQGMQALRASMLGILTGDQQAQYQQNLAGMRARHRTPGTAPSPAPPTK